MECVTQWILQSKGLLPAEVFRMINQLNSRKANSPENIAVKYKLANECISNFLSEIFNLCALQGVFPHKLKLAKVIPIHKGGCVLHFSK